MSDRVFAESEVPQQSDAHTWVPLPMQRQALACGCYELFLGGAAGPGKSEYLVAAPLRYVHYPTFTAVLFRNSFPELERTLVSKSRRLYPSMGGEYDESSHTWHFRSGATVEFSYLERDRDVHRYQGAEYCFVGFDELPHFTEYSYRYMGSRLRSPAGVPIRLRATGNPDGPHLAWVRKRFASWIDKLHPAGEVRWFDPEGRDVPKGTADSLSRSYIPGRLKDNPYLGPKYRAQLMALDPVTRAKLLEGDWDACIGEGKLFHRTWWGYVDQIPADAEATVRAWDLGATADGDPTRGVRIHRRPEGVVPRFVISDVVTVRGAPHEVRALQRATAETDGKRVAIVIPQDPGQAGIDQVDAFRRDFVGYDVRVRRPSKEKVVRARPYSAQVGARNFALVRGPWNEELVSEHHAFPDGPHDDIVDAAGDGFAELAGEPTPIDSGAVAALRRRATAAGLFLPRT